MKHQIRCAHCGRQFSPNPRVKKQRYCGERACQNTRKRLWQKEKLATDLDYKENLRDSQKAWCSRNPHYWKDYRRDHPDYTRRNRELQKLRDRGLCSRSVDLAKMDALEQPPTVKPGTYYLIPDSMDLAKMDASAQKVCLIPIT